MRYFFEEDVQMHLECLKILWSQYKDKFAHWLIGKDVCGTDDAYDMLEAYYPRL